MALMETAPKYGEVIEALFDGEWIEVSWSESAYDGSPYGAEGWAQDGNLITDLEAWRPLDHVQYGDPSPLDGHYLRQPLIVVGLGFGDESKGATVDYLSSAIPDTIAVVRWSGGANASHNVHHGYRNHAFRQFGSGTFLGLPTLLTERVVVNLQILMAEAVELEALGVIDPLSLMAIHGDALVTTPIHIAMNRAREILRGSERHGSCGLGIGETIVHSYAERQGLSLGHEVGNFDVPGETAGGKGVLTMEKLIREDSEDLFEDVLAILEYQAHYAGTLISEAKIAMPDLASELDYAPLKEIAAELIAVAKSVDVLLSADFDRELIALMERGTVIFEGSQGILLDEQWGFHPHTTWSRIEPSEIASWLYDLGHDPYVLGLTRTFFTRHGEGPLPSDRALIISDQDIPEDDNSWGRWQGGFRNAPLDLPLLRYSQSVLKASGVDLHGISISHLDAFSHSQSVPVIRSYSGDTNPTVSWDFLPNDDFDFPRMNSDAFLEDAFLLEEPELEHYAREDMVQLISSSLYRPVVLLARGPNRMDRELTHVSAYWKPEEIGAKK